MRPREHLETFQRFTKCFPFTTFTSQFKISWGSAPHLGSTFDVALSRINIWFFLRIALARHTSCFWPTLKFNPNSANSVFILAGRPSMDFLSCTCGYRKNNISKTNCCWSRQASSTLELWSPHDFCILHVQSRDGKSCFQLVFTEKDGW